MITTTYHYFDSQALFMTVLISSAIVIHGYLISRKPPPKNI